MNPDFDNNVPDAVARAQAMGITEIVVFELFPLVLEARAVFKEVKGHALDMPCVTLLVMWSCLSSPLQIRPLDGRMAVSGTT